MKWLRHNEPGLNRRSTTPCSRGAVTHENSTATTTCAKASSPPSRKARPFRTSPPTFYARLGAREFRYGAGPIGCVAAAGAGASVGRSACWRDSSQQLGSQLQIKATTNTLESTLWLLPRGVLRAMFKNRNPPPDAAPSK